ncbi:PRKC apoptosis WT1 regulator protein [Simochromis diagramma]|uniref:PRKC apoptosis WT1 regulator protein n=1 Tax=Simochromis diagramma TaxID=43689 RepID=UPI001A7E9FEC|nr:PRKC apoptosis WT1 regulator protein [Simochromis diagramma]XP_039891562.1 PRKC apoptosis WT1 regulator protein [Simochromis diagramma]XP_039891563.1 PRKC apoptosis WT1 regulator protein [Simochromis diagramma]
MATGGFKSSAATDFLEEWKAKREKMRAKMLGDIAAATGTPLGASNTNSSRNAVPPPSPPPLPSATEFTNNGNPDRSSSAGNCHPSSYAVARSSSGTSLKRPEEEMHHPVTPSATPGSNLKKALPQPETTQDSTPMACNDSDKESPSPSSKGKEKKSTGPSARKGKGQIEKRKLREKRRSTGVVNIPSNESLDELDDDDGGEKDRREEEELVQANTFQNESMTADPATGYLLETPRSGSGRYKSFPQMGLEEDTGGNSRQRHNRHGRDGGASAPGSLEKRIEDLERELARERQENARLLKAYQDKDDLIGKLKEEIDLLNQDLDDIEDENEQLKQENKTLLKVVGQLTR